MTFRNRLIFFLFAFIPSLLIAQSDNVRMFETGQFKNSIQTELADVTRIISESEIRLRGANNLKDILMMETGGVFNYDPQKGWQFQWHGSTKGNILILIDGLPFRSVQFDEMDLQQIPLDHVSRIEITENPQGVSYGSSAIMGVINIISKTTQQKVYKPSIRVQGYTPGSFYSNLNLGRRTTKTFFRFSSAIDANAGKQGNDSGRVLQWLPYTRITNQLSYSQKVLKHLDATFGFSNLYENKTQTGYPFQGSNRAIDHVFIHHSNALYATLKGNLTKNFRMQVDLYLQDFRRQNTLILKNILTAEQLAINDTLLNDTVHYTLAFSRWVLLQNDKNKPFTYQGGFDISSTVDQYKNTVNNVHQSNTTSSLFINLNYSGIKNLRLNSGVRLPYSSKYKTKPIWDFKLNYKITEEWFMKFIVAQATKAPTFDQMFATYLTNGYSIKRNLNITDEQVLSIHYSILFKKNNLSIEPGFFNYFFKNGIELVTDKVQPNRMIHQNISEKRTIGTRINILFQNKFVDLNLRGILTGNNYFANLFDRQLFYTEAFMNVTFKVPRAGLNICYVNKICSERGYMIMDAQKQTQTYFNPQFYLADAVIEKLFNKKTIALRGGVKNIMNIKNLHSFYLPTLSNPEYFSSVLLSGRSLFFELNITL